MTRPRSFAAELVEELGIRTNEVSITVEVPSKWWSGYVDAMTEAIRIVRRVERRRARRVRAGRGKSAPHQPCIECGNDYAEGYCPHKKTRQRRGKEARKK